MELTTKLEAYRQKYKKHTFIKTVFGNDYCKRRCIVFIEEIRRDKFGYICAKGWGVNGANEFKYTDFGLDGNLICVPSQQEIEFWKRQRAKAFFSEKLNINTSVEDFC